VDDRVFLHDLDNLPLRPGQHNRTYASLKSPKDRALTVNHHQVADIQPAILNQFGQISLLPWIGVGFALATTCVLPWGKAYGVFNAKYLYLFNIILFEVGSAICGSAPNMTALILGRVIAGVGGSGMYSGTLSFVAMLTSLRERPIYMAGSTVIWGIGSVLGPVVSLMGLI
jgi:MFS family permease